ncbi:centromere protein M isoform X1 [Harpia harpyja]|uniref:centromere protein M isoform X1 n=1 Tax=Harpia harpyja TaxID=202280 RepID=UPI0022B1342B|nr:centromere protein M isoform X1 [Harpia harpyja]
MRGAQVFFCLLRDGHIQELNTLGRNGTSTTLATTCNQTSFPERCPLLLVLFRAIFCHLATSLPLPPERDHLRPRIDLVAFMIDIKSKYSLKNVEASLAYVDDSFFLGKVCFLVAGVGRVNYCSVEMNAIRNLGEVYCSPVLFCELEVEGSQVATAQRLLRMLEICAGHVPGVSALSFSSLMRNCADD